MVNEIEQQSQHDFALTAIGAPRVCSVDIHNPSQISKCIEDALSLQGKAAAGYVHPDLTRSSFLNRVRVIFGTFH